MSTVKRRDGSMTIAGLILALCDNEYAYAVARTDDQERPRVDNGWFETVGWTTATVINACVKAKWLKARLGITLDNGAREVFWTLTPRGKMASFNYRTNDSRTTEARA